MCFIVSIICLSPHEKILLDSGNKYKFIDFGTLLVFSKIIETLGDYPNS